MRLIITLACSLALQTACDSPTKSEDVKSDRIAFSDMQVGQTSSYVSFAVSGYWGPDQTFEYAGDSLIVTVTGAQADGYLITERLVDVDTTDWWVGSDTVTYLLLVSMDTLKYRKLNSSDRTSRLYYWLEKMDLPLAPAVSAGITLDGWRPSFSSGTCCLGILDSIELMGQTYGPLYGILLDSTPVDGPALWWFYSANDGLVRHFAINPWINAGKGWDLLP